MNKQGQIPVDDNILSLLIEIGDKRAPSGQGDILLIDGNTHDQLLIAGQNNPDISIKRVSNFDIVVKVHHIPVMIVGAGFIQQPFALCSQDTVCKMGLIREVKHA